MNTRLQRRLRRTVVAPTLMLVCLAAVPAAARQPGPHYRIGTVPGLADPWRSELEAADAALRAGRYREARRRAQKTTNGMFKVVRGGRDAGPLLGLAVLFRALAEAGLGNEEAASWDWHMVAALHAPLTESDLSAYGDLGARMAENKPRMPVPCESCPDANATATADGDISPPQRAKAAPPRYPPALNLSCITGTVVVQMVLTRDGTPTLPVNLSTDSNPIFVYSAFETLRNWRFNPARLGGRPVTVFYNLTINFKAPWCQG